MSYYGPDEVVPVVPEMSDEREDVDDALLVQLLDQRVDRHVRTRATHSLATGERKKDLFTSSTQFFFLYAICFRIIEREDNFFLNWSVKQG